MSPLEKRDLLQITRHLNAASGTNSHYMPDSFDCISGDCVQTASQVHLNNNQKPGEGVVFHYKTSQRTLRAAEHPKQNTCR